MAWSNSKIFRAFGTDVMTRAVAHDIDTDAILVALYNNTGTPDQDVSAANSAYNAGQWATANEVSQSVTWPAGGVALANRTVTNPAAATIMFDGDDTASGASATLSGAYGCLVYNNTTATKAGISFHYFGGSQSVTSGVFTVVWHASGLWRLTF